MAVTAGLAAQGLSVCSSLFAALPALLTAGGSYFCTACRCAWRCAPCLHPTGRTVGRRVSGDAYSQRCVMGSAHLLQSVGMLPELVTSV
jgi:hypothetical protein